MSIEAAVFGGGCFWCLDAQFRLVPGVVSVECGYAGGQTDTPSYESVSRGDTGHAEVIRVNYDPEEVDFWELCELFFSCHDPTTPNRQGHDIGTQYRSIIVCLDDAQRSTAEALIMKWNAAAHWPAPIVTELCRNTRFYPAEEYHQDYLARNPQQGYCIAVVSPKLAKFRDVLSRRARTSADRG